jgi:glycolate dehydrogenase FAD-binding subunit
VVSHDPFDELVAAAGEAHARPGAGADAVAGVPVRWVVAPADTAAVAAVLRVATAHGLSVVARGGGSKLDWGLPPSRVDLVVDVARLAGVVEHAAGDLVATVRAGTPLATVQSALATAGQRIALDPGSPAPTVGGMLATNEAGPLRLGYGAPRDLLIGVELVRADGVVAHSGGRVVKNVAGYDLGKLLCGSYGTLGVITSATFRLHPLPAARAWVVRPVRTPLEMHDLLGELMASPLAPAAVEVDLPGEGEPARGLLAVLLEGSVRGVGARADATRALLGPDSSTVDDAPAWWGRYPFGPDDIALKLVTPIADLHAAVYALSDAAGGPVPVRGSAGAGVVYAALPGDLPAQRLAAILDGVRTTLLLRGGSCAVLRAPAPARDAVDLSGELPGLALMRRVKERFDPLGTLAPGRVVGGR